MVFSEALRKSDVRVQKKEKRKKEKKKKVKKGNKFSQIVKKACLMTITQCNSNNSLTPDFKWASFERKNCLDELIDIPTKAEKDL